MTRNNYCYFPIKLTGGISKQIKYIGVDRGLRCDRCLIVTAVRFDIKTTVYLQQTNCVLPCFILENCTCIITSNYTLPDGKHELLLM